MKYFWIAGEYYPMGDNGGSREKFNTAVKIYGLLPTNLMLKKLFSEDTLVHIANYKEITEAEYKFWTEQYNKEYGS